MNDSEKTREQLEDELVYLRSRLEKIESVLVPQNHHHALIAQYPFLKNTPVGLNSPEEQILFTRFSVEAAADEVFWMQADAKLLYVNNSACRRLGYSHEEMAQMYVWDWDPLFSKERWEKFWQEMLTRNYICLETQHRCKNGEIFPVEIVAKIFDYLGEKYLFAFVKDIKERKEKEFALENEQHKYKTILETAVDGFWLTDLQGQLLEVNDAYCQMSGYTNEELLTLKISELEGTMDAETVAAKIKEVRVKGYARFETLHRRKNGTLYPVEIVVKHLKTEDGGRLVNFTRDLSPQILIQHSLRQHESFLRSLLATLPDLVWLKDKNGVFLACNRTFERLLGTTEENIVGKTDYDFLDSELADFFRAKDQEVIAAGKPKSNEEWITFADTGQHALLETIKTPMNDQQGELIGVLGVGRDITERKRSEETILNNERKFRNLLESTSTVPWELDLASGRFTYMGKQIEQILGYAAESWVNIESWEDKLHQNDRQGAIALRHQKTAQGTDYDHIYRAIHLDGSLRWIRDVVSVVMDGRGPQKLVGFMQDITTQKVMEEEKNAIAARLQQAQKMEAIGTLAGGIAHDFNNILGAILGFAELARLDSRDREQRLKDLEQILIAGNRAKDLVKQILAFSRKSQVERMPIQIQPIINEGLKMLRSSIPATISIVVSIDPHCGTILADTTQIHQILVNLCTNAYQAMESRGGQLSVTLKTVWLNTQTPKFPVHVSSGEYLELSISDSGCGISPEIKGKIFEPYFTTKDPGKGTGMGLSIIHGIVSEYGGAITVDSAPGKGTTVHVYLPVIHQHACPTTSDSNTIESGSERILFIDDEEMLILLGKEILQNLGYQVIPCRSSVEALHLFQETPEAFDIVITDQTMPDMTGVELAQRILQIRPTTPIILCTGYSDLIDETTTNNLGIKELAYKPLSVKKLSSLIRKVLNGEHDSDRLPHSDSEKSTE